MWSDATLIMVVSLATPLKSQEIGASVAMMMSWWHQYNIILQLTGQVDECCCDVESVDTLNNDKIYPIISSVVKQTFFKFFKVS